MLHAGVFMVVALALGYAIQRFYRENIIVRCFALFLGDCSWTGSLSSGSRFLSVCPCLGDPYLADYPCSELFRRFGGGFGVPPFVQTQAT